ncbi:MAG: tetratricopeptide repeat protein [Bacteroidota bacterium]
MTNQKSIAVLPFENLSSDPENEYFSDGMTEEIINALTRIEELKVTARTSSFAFKGLKEDIRIIGSKLGVSTVLEGSIRKAGNRVRITAQLIRTDNGFHFWSENFDRELKDIFELQDEISLLIAEKIREDFGHMEIQEHLVIPKTSSNEAYDFYLKGTQHFKRKDLEDVKKALSLFEDAVAIDPHFSEAWACIGETYLHYTGFNFISPTEGIIKAREATNRALKINPKECRAHKTLAFIHLFYDRDWNQAIASYNQAMTSGMPANNDFVSYYYVFIEKNYQLAIDVAKETISKDPIHASSHWHLGVCFYFSQRFEEALEAFEQSLECDPDYGESLRWKGLVLAFLGRDEEAYRFVDRALEITKGEGLAVYDRLKVRILAGHTDGIEDEIDAMDHHDPCDAAELYSLLRRPEKAVEYLKQGLKENSMMLVTLKHFWTWDNIRKHQGFKEIYDQMDFTDHKAHKAHPSSSLLVTTTNNALTEKESDEILSKINEQASQEFTIVNQNLTMRTLAEKINIHPNKLSWVLNEKIGKNFNEFINDLRLSVFQKKAADPKNSHLSILGLAYESGFTSKTVFNNFFKKQMGMTPKKWLSDVKK